MRHYRYKHRFFHLRNWLYISSYLLQLSNLLDAQGPSSLLYSSPHQQVQASMQTQNLCHHLFWMLKIWDTDTEEQRHLLEAASEIWPFVMFKFRSLLLGANLIWHIKLVEYLETVLIYMRGQHCPPYHKILLSVKKWMCLTRSIRGAGRHLNAGIGFFLTCELCDCYAFVFSADSEENNETEIKLNFKRTTVMWHGTCSVEVSRFTERKSQRIKQNGRRSQRTFLKE